MDEFGRRCYKSYKVRDYDFNEIPPTPTGSFPLSLPLQPGYSNPRHLRESPHPHRLRREQHHPGVRHLLLVQRLPDAVISYAGNDTPVRAPKSTGP